MYKFALHLRNPIVLTFIFLFLYTGKNSRIVKLTLCNDKIFFLIVKKGPE